MIVLIFIYTILYMQILPGKIEFFYLPINCQSVVIVPLPNGQAAVMGTNQAKVLTLKDLNRIRSTVNIYKNLVVDVVVNT